MRERNERISLPGQVESVTAGRHFLTLILAEWGLSAWTDPVALAASEVLTNAVVHAGTPIEVGLQLSRGSTQDLSSGNVVGGVLVVWVRDGCPPWTPTPPPGGVGLPEWDSESGRGLALVEAVSDAWGVRPEPTGKTVWFSLRVPAPTTGRPGS